MTELRRSTTLVPVGRGETKTQVRHIFVGVDGGSEVTAVNAFTPGEAELSLAVVGTPGLGGISGLRLGRVPIQLVHHTSAAVVIVPPREASGDADAAS